MMVEQEVRTQQRPSFLAYAQMHRAVGEGDDLWQDLARRVKEGKIIPILSNSLRDDRFMRLFGIDNKSLASFIGESWAASDQVGYPMNDADNLARVAQYHQVTAGNPEKAKRDFLDFMVQGLLGFAQSTDHGCGRNHRGEEPGRDTPICYSPIWSPSWGIRRSRRAKKT